MRGKAGRRTQIPGYLVMVILNQCCSQAAWMTKDRSATSKAVPFIKRLGAGPSRKRTHHMTIKSKARRGPFPPCTYSTQLGKLPLLFDQSKYWHSVIPTSGKSPGSNFRSSTLQLETERDVELQHQAVGAEFRGSHGTKPKMQLAPGLDIAMA